MKTSIHPLDPSARNALRRIATRALFILLASCIPGAFADAAGDGPAISPQPDFARNPIANCCVWGGDEK